MTAPGARLSHPPRWLLVLAVLSVPAWLLFTRWTAQDVSGWAQLARVHAAGERALDGSVGTVTVALERSGLPRTVFEDSRGRRATIELGFSDEGYWLRSQRATPAPALHVPWGAVRRCLYFSAWFHHPDLQDLRLTVQHPDFEQCCATATWGGRLRDSTGWDEGGVCRSSTADGPLSQVKLLRLGAQASLEAADTP